MKFEIGDRVAMPGVPITVTVTGFGRCEDGDECELGGDTFTFDDPGGHGTDSMHVSEFKKVTQ